MVRFDTLYGGSHGRWVGPLPSVGERYDVELTIDETLVWGETAELVDETVPRIDREGECVLLQGVLDAVYSNGVAVLRLGSSIISFLASGTAPHPGSPIRLQAQRLSLYDTNM